MSDKTIRKNIVIYELNEVPKKIIDYYINLKPLSNLSKLIKSGFYSETITDDVGELHPWSSWPTVHRGVDSSIHKIKFINQNLDHAKIYPPIWEVLIEKKVSVGIFGSLQSYPPLKSKYVKFFIPDTFAPKPDTYPSKFSKFQDLNLSLTMRNKAYNRPLRLEDFYRFFILFISLRISISVVLELFLHMIKEIFVKKQKKRRALLQPVLSFDLFQKLLLHEQPSFSTFFTNHVAGVMHRYWRDTFPNEFHERNISFSNQEFNKRSLIKAMDIADRQIGLLHHLQEKRNGELWIISALGQEAINNIHKEDLILENESKLRKILNLDTINFEFLPAMHPDLNIKCLNNDKLMYLRRKILDIKDENGKNFIVERYNPSNNTINFVTESTNKLIESNSIIFNQKKYTLREFGFKIIKRDIGTAYHTNKGIFISNKKLENNHLKSINKKFFHNYLKEYFSS